MTSKESSTNFALLKEKILGNSGKEYWRSVEEFVDAPEFEEFVKEEYPKHAEEWENGLSRRNFVKVMGASLAFAGLSGCVVQPAEKIVPYVIQPEGVTPGKPLYFATSMTLGGVSNGLLGRSHEGRPTKIEGNPDHPASLGSTDTLAQAAILNLYDPDRSQAIQYRGVPKSWQDFITAFRSEIEANRADGGAGVRFLTETVTSPTMIDQFKRLKEELPNSKWVQYEPVNNDNVLQGAKLAFGSTAQPVYKFDKAERILSLDAEFFNDFNSRYATDFAKGREAHGEDHEMNRLYAIETSLTLVGAKADHRLAVKPSEMIEYAKAAAGAVGVEGASGSAGNNDAWIKAMAKDLSDHKGKSLVVAGKQQPAYVHALAFAMNDALGNVGETVEFVEPMSPDSDTSQADRFKELVSEIDKGDVKLLVILGANPAYAAPSDLRFTKERLDKVGLRVHVGEYFDETGAYCHWHVPATNFLEEWSDGRTYDGTISISQPLAQPLYRGRSFYEIIQLAFKDNFDRKGYDIIQEYWKAQGMKPVAAPASTSASDEKTEAPANTEESNSGDGEVKNFITDSEPVAAVTPSTNGAAAPGKFEDNWKKVVHDGFLAGSAAPAKSVTVTTSFISDSPSIEGDGALEVAILPDPSVYDGRFANNGWLQELPKPLTKITWENVALISPNTAKKLGINQDKRYNDYAGGELGRSFITTKGGNMESDMISVTVGDGKIERVPAWIAPGQPDDVVTIYLGYGRTRAGKVGNGIGYDAYSAQKSDAMWFSKGNVAKTGERASVASTQIHFNMEGRDLLRNWELDEIEAKGKEHEAAEVQYKKSMYGNAHGETYDKHDKWAMTIDLNSCVGCNACVLACQSENNIPVVGKEQVERSREMHWMRIDAYYKGDMSDPEGPHFQPVLCMQCEQAPCEVVCPVHATVHSAEGLNDMVYNRCIGTRYCSNNCPYKVRRFNFFLYQDWDTPQYKMMRNPEVSVRSRGVMEKCTYCTQRISAARIEAKREDREVRDGEIVTACQSACPTNAIVFGNQKDEKSQVAKLKKDHRNYALLNHELNTQPRTSYLAGIRNPNKEMPDYKAPEKSEEGH
ncbi:MAG: TAT-variant-translocated molybdopterin oxidoreductase [Pyrinomonadaceae bacterium]|nr:TAT-variant-translocated molybdopterin oxidoreductase [Pyrinomonadaceae bacterium]